MVALPGLPPPGDLGKSVWALPWIVTVVLVSFNQKRPKRPCQACPPSDLGRSVWAHSWIVTVVFCHFQSENAIEVLPGLPPPPDVLERSF